MRHNACELAMQMPCKPVPRPQRHEQLLRGHTAQAAAMNVLLEMGFLSQQSLCVAVLIHALGPVMGQKDVERARYALCNRL